jgi:DNA-binding transcriptional regulator LsrR (DeoR family)
VQRIRNEDFLAELARAYYELDLTQEQVALQFGISRSQVSRYLAEARQREIVQIRIIAPESREDALEGEIRARFPHLRDVIVAAAFSSNPATIRQTVARAGARLVDRLVKPGMIISTGAGRTLAALVDLLVRRPIGNVTIAQAMGNAGHEGLAIDYYAVAQRAAAAYDARALQINAPAILGPGVSAADLEASNPPIREALGEARRADLYVVGIGSITGDQIYVDTGLITRLELDGLASAGAVGDLCGNFFDLSGRAIGGPFDDRLVGVRLSDLRRAPVSMGVGGGSEKVAAIVGALEGCLINSLVTDEHTARGVLELAGSRGRRTAVPQRSVGGVS